MIYLALACRLTLLGVFTFSSASKLRSRAAYREFTASTAALSTLPRRSARSARSLAAGVVGAELAVVALLAWPAAVRFGYLAAMALLAAFTVAIGRAVGRRVDVPCRCFGGSTTPTGLHHIARNLALLAVAALGLVAGWPGAAGLEPAPAVVAGLAAAVAVALVLALDDLVMLFRPLR